jgi:hypothetical protein
MSIFLVASYFSVSCDALVDLRQSARQIDFAHSRLQFVDVPYDCVLFGLQLRVEGLREEAPS